MASMSIFVIMFLVMKGYEVLIMEKYKLIRNNCVIP